MALLSDKEQKKAFKKQASADPDSFYPTRTCNDDQKRINAII